MKEKLFLVKCQFKVFVGFDTTDYGYHGVGAPSTVLSKYEFFVLSNSLKQAEKTVKVYFIQNNTEKVFGKELSWRFSKKPFTEKEEPFVERALEFWNKKWKEEDSKIEIELVKNFLS